MVFDTIIKNGLTVDFQNMKTVTRTLYIKDGLLAQGAEGDTCQCRSPLHTHGRHHGSGCRHMRLDQF